MHCRSLVPGPRASSLELCEILLQLSSENVEIIRRATDDFNRRDVEAWLTHFDPNVVWYAIPDEPEPGPFRGREAVRAMAARWMDSFRDFRMEVKEYIDAGEYVITPARMLGRISDSDANIGIDDVFVNRCRNGKIVEVRECRTRADALEVVGLSGDAQTSS